MRSRPTVALVLAAVALAAACSSDGDDAGPTSGTDVTTEAAVCAWAVRADKATLNIAYPDTAATYWGMSYDLAPGEHLELAGRFPAARYASFITYGPNGGAVDVLTDRDIEPDPGSTNPFRAGSMTGGTAAGGVGTYTFTIRPDLGSTDETNVLGARVESTEVPGTTPGTSIAPAADRVVVGGGDGRRGSVLYRVYVPTDPADAMGGAGLPDVRLVDASGSSTAVPTCAEPGPSEAAVRIVENFERGATAVPATPIFIRPAGNQANLYPNPDNVYVATIVAHQPGKVVVVRGRAPTFPDTGAADAIGGDEQVRYWSMCTNELRKPYPVTECAADHEVALDADGTYTFVISTPGDRPAETAATTGSTWLDWGATDVDGLLLMRHMLASPDFPEAATNLAPGSLAEGTMGAYAPRGAYCDKAVFEAGGAVACGL